jgi:hydrogenase maturation factor
VGQGTEDPHTACYSIAINGQGKQMTGIQRTEETSTLIASEQVGLYVVVKSGFHMFSNNCWLKI